MSSSDIPTCETLAFVLDNLPEGQSRILEVGCGSGRLAGRLSAFGHELVAIDSSPESVEAARRLEVNARLAVFPDFEDEPFDVVLFTRSLHHIHPLDSAVEQARRLLNPKGLLLAEDFAFSDVEEHTAVWFYRLLELLETCGVLLPSEGSFGRSLLEAGGSFSLWGQDEHELNSDREMVRAVGARLSLIKHEASPYLYRYISEMVTPDDRGGLIVSRVLELEKAAGAGDNRHLIGRRFVARKSAV